MSESRPRGFLLLPEPSTPKPHRVHSVHVNQTDYNLLKCSPQRSKDSSPTESKPTNSLASLSKKRSAPASAGRRMVLDTVAKMTGTASGGQQKAVEELHKRVKPRSNCRASEGECHRVLPDRMTICKPSRFMESRSGGQDKTPSRSRTHCAMSVHQQLFLPCSGVYYICCAPWPMIDRCSSHRRVHICSLESREQIHCNISLRSVSFRCSVSVPHVPEFTASRCHHTLQLVRFAGHFLYGSMSWSDCISRSASCSGVARTHQCDTLPCHVTACTICNLLQQTISPCTVDAGAMSTKKSMTSSEACAPCLSRSPMSNTVTLQGLSKPSRSLIAPRVPKLARLDQSVTWPQPSFPCVLLAHFHHRSVTRHLSCIVAWISLVRRCVLKSLERRTEKENEQEDTRARARERERKREEQCSKMYAWCVFAENCLGSTGKAYTTCTCTPFPSNTKHLTCMLDFCISCCYDDDVLMRGAASATTSVQCTCYS